MGVPCWIIDPLLAFPDWKMCLSSKAEAGAEGDGPGVFGLEWGHYTELAEAAGRPHP